MKYFVMGMGFELFIFVEIDDEVCQDMMVSMEYLFWKDEFVGVELIIVVGFGQSAVEIFFDLL